LEKIALLIAQYCWGRGVRGRGDAASTFLGGGSDRGEIYYVCEGEGNILLA